MRLKQLIAPIRNNEIITLVVWKAFDNCCIWYLIRKWTVEMFNNIITTEKFNLFLSSILNMQFKMSLTKISINYT